jgi:hypothetical protein
MTIIWAYFRWAAERIFLFPHEHQEILEQVEDSFQKE